MKMRKPSRPDLALLLIPGGAACLYFGRDATGNELWFYMLSGAWFMAQGLILLWQDHRRR